MLFRNYKIYHPAPGNLSFCRLKAHNVLYDIHICIRTYYTEMQLPLCSSIFTHRVKWVLYQTNSNINYILRKQIPILYHLSNYIWYAFASSACCRNPTTLPTPYAGYYTSPWDQRPSYTYIQRYSVNMVSIFLLLLWSISCSFRVIVISEFEGINCQMTFERANEYFTFQLLTTFDPVKWIPVTRAFNFGNPCIIRTSGHFILLNWSLSVMKRNEIWLSTLNTVFSRWYWNCFSSDINALRSSSVSILRALQILCQK